MTEIVGDIGAFNPRRHLEVSQIGTPFTVFVQNSISCVCIIGPKGPKFQRPANKTGNKNGLLVRVIDSYVSLNLDVERLIIT